MGKKKTYQAPPVSRLLMLDDMFTWGGEEFSRGTLDVRCEFYKRENVCRNSIELEGAMPTTVPTSSWRLAGAIKIFSETHPYCSPVWPLIQAESWAKKNATRIRVAVQLCSSH